MQNVTHESQTGPALTPAVLIAEQERPREPDSAVLDSAASWDGDDASLDGVRESLRAARQQLDGAIAVLRERGALHMDAAEAFARVRSLCRRAERRLVGACGALSPDGAASASTPTSVGVTRVRVKAVPPRTADLT